MITYTFAHSTHGNVTASLSPSEALATLASLEAHAHRINTPSAIRNRGNEARALRLAMGRAPMGDVASLVCEASQFATLPVSSSFPLLTR